MLTLTSSSSLMSRCRLCRTAEGVNSFVTRAIKKMMISTKEQGKNTTLFVVGEKGRSQLSRIHADVSRRKRHGYRSRSLDSSRVNVAAVDIVNYERRQAFMPTERVPC